MTEEDEFEETIEIRYEVADDYRTLPASRIIGGVQLNGEFLLDFVFDKTVTGGYEERELTDTGVGDTVNDERDTYIQQKKQVGVVMGQNQAFEAATWIISDLLGEGISKEEVEEVVRSEYPEKFE